MIIWGSKLQPAVALSLVEAEYMALSTSSKEVAFLRHSMITLGEPMKGPTPMFEDNKEADSLATNKMTAFKCKYIDIRYHFVRDLVAAKVISIVWIKSAEMIADMMLSGTYSGP
jgi:hypothetical protein